MGGLATLRILLGSTIALSLVHYADNYAAFDLYPQEGAVIEVSRDAVWISWLVFAAFGAAGYRLYRRGRFQAASLCLGVFSVSGLISLGHYSARGMSELAWWRHASIWIDIVLGAMVLAFALRTALRRPAMQQPA